jgi:hypothetical protein
MTTKTRTFCRRTPHVIFPIMFEMPPLTTMNKKCIFSMWLLLSLLLISVSPSASREFGVSRGGASKQVGSNEAFGLLARALESKFDDIGSEKLEKSLVKLASAQQTFKGLDGAAHEAYQRTHSGVDVDTAVSGRAQRSAARVAATAEALLACELIEIVENPQLVEEDVLVGRQVIANITIEDKTVPLGESSLAVLVLYEEAYDRGSGLDHGTISSWTESDRRKGRAKPKGRLIVVLGETISRDMSKTMKLLDQKPQRVKLSSGLVVNEVASVQPTLYKSAGKLLEVLEPHLRKYNETAVHFVGRSVAGGVAALSCVLLEGTLPFPASKKAKRRPKRKKQKNEDEEAVSDDTTAKSTENPDETETEAEPVLEPLNGFGRARSSALTLGAPPCLSSNVIAAFCTSILYGDDFVCRATRDSLETLCNRIQRSISGGFVGRNLGFVSDTLSLTVSSLKTHAHGSEGEEVKLSTPGRGYLVRPRRLGGICSIHEVGNLNKGGREALRANLLWQLNDILLSKSMWKHHRLSEYIHGLDRVQLRGSNDEEWS